LGPSHLNENCGPACLTQQRVGYCTSYTVFKITCLPVYARWDVMKNLDRPGGSVILFSLTLDFVL
jgi:hypothetical protein